MLHKNNIETHDNLFIKSWTQIQDTFFTIMDTLVTDNLETEFDPKDPS